jgi:hypothetical protein
VWRGGGNGGGGGCGRGGANDGLKRNSEEIQDDSSLIQELLWTFKLPASVLDVTLTYDRAILEINDSFLSHRTVNVTCAYRRSEAASSSIKVFEKVRHIRFLLYRN